MGEEDLIGEKKSHDLGFGLLELPHKNYFNI